jgi:uncharacterized protein (TIGR02453 family)
MKQVINFLAELQGNNTREWFTANKSRYADVKALFDEFTAKMIKEVASFDSAIGLLAPKDCTFRIYRDVRFSKDKDPYKNNMGAYLNRGGKNSRYAGYYLHIEPGASFIGGGKWMPEADILKLIRLEIYHFPEEFKKIINQKEFVKKFGSLSGDKLKKPPKDFPPDFPDIELLKFKSYTVGMNLTDETVMSERLLGQAVDAFKTMMPLIHFLNRAVEESQS